MRRVGEMLRSVLGELIVIDQLNQSPAVRVHVKHALDAVHEARQTELRENGGIPVPSDLPVHLVHRHD